MYICRKQVVKKHSTSKNNKPKKPDIVLKIICKKWRIQTKNNILQITPNELVDERNTYCRKNTVHRKQ